MRSILQGSDRGFGPGGALHTKKCQKFSSRGVRLCTHEKVPKIFLARGAIVHTRKSAKYLLFFSKCPAGGKIWDNIPGFTYNFN